MSSSEECNDNLDGISGGQLTINISNSKVPVPCTPDGWTVIQSRGQFNNPKDFFYKTWSEYVAGFGTIGQKIDINTFWYDAYSDISDNY